MAQRVVDRLELVEIDEQDRDMFAMPPAPQQRFPEPLEERRPVGQLRERVVMGHEFELLFVSLEARNVVEHRYEIRDVTALVAYRGRTR